MLKRPLPVYDDLDEFDHEEGEICESKSEEVGEITELSDDEMAAKAVLPVGRFDVNFKLGDEPTSGEQYLCLVKHERTRLPKTEVSQNNASLSKTLDEILAGKLVKSEYLLEVDQAWAESCWTQFCQDYEEMKAQMEAIEHVHVIFPEDKKSSEAWLKFIKETELSVDVCVALAEDQFCVWKLLSLIPSWLGSKDRTSLVGWMRYLLFCLDRQLSSSQISTLRGLVKSLARFDDSNIKEIISVIVKAYGQHDLIKLV